MNRIRIVIIKNKIDDHDFVKVTVEKSGDMEIAGMAGDFAQGGTTVRACNPEIVLVQDGPAIVEFTAAVLRNLPQTAVLILTSGKDPGSGPRVVAALAAGAFDFVDGIDLQENGAGASATLANVLLSKIRCCSIHRYSAMARAGETGRGKNQKEVERVNQAPRKRLSLQYDAVLIGVSTGGPEALLKMIPALPEAMPVPLIIVLHMPANFTGPMAAALDHAARIRVKEVVDGEEPVAGKAYLARGGLHCTIARGPAGRPRLNIVDGPPENNCKPSVDALFRSGASVFGKRVIAIVLTGMGSDGAKGALAIKTNGGTVLVQDERSSVVWGMPGSVVRCGVAPEIIALNRMPSRLCEILGF
ncbi:MAG: chemotaxis protein CheB [Chitinivibrionales bacterium]|nr:chemotaxis protein CheB [Chitinivibrionales bacterium]